MAAVSEELLEKLPIELQVEIYENIQRKNYTQLELAKIQKKLKDEFSEHTEQGRRIDLENKPLSQNGTEVNRTDEKIGKIFSENRKTVNKRISVFEAAQEDPEKYGDLTDRLEKSVNSAYRELKRREEAEERREKLEGAPELKNLLLGGCLEKIEEIPKNSVDCVVTDPPYGINVESGTREQIRKLRKNWTYEGDDEDIFSLLRRLFEKLEPKLKDDAHVYIFTSWKAWHNLYPLAEDFFDVRNWLVYLHYQSTGGDLNVYRTAVSSILFAAAGSGRKIRKHKWNFFDEKGTYREDGKSYHPAQKSVSICKKLIENSTVEGETILDPFAGSGSTLVAAEKLDRNWFGIELEKRWYKTAKFRIAEVQDNED